MDAKNLCPKSFLTCKFIFHTQYKQACTWTINLQIKHDIPYQELSRSCLVVDTLLITNLPQIQVAHRPIILWSVREVWSGITLNQGF